MVCGHDVTVVVDSSSCLPPDLVCKWNITVVPHQLLINGRSYRDGVDLHPSDFYQMLREHRVVSTTAAPSPQEFLNTFLSAGEMTSNILCLTLSANLSVAYNSALTAMEQAGERLSHCAIKVIDSQAAAGASGLIALAAARWAKQGHTLERVEAGVTSLMPKVNLLAVLDTFYYLHRSGRVSFVKAWTGSLLGVKPLTELKQGKAFMLERPRGRLAAIGRVVDIMRQRVGETPIMVNVMEADAADDAQMMLQHIQRGLNCRESITSQFTPVMGSHTGPGVLGVAFYACDEEQSPFIEA